MDVKGRSGTEQLTVYWIGSPEFNITAVSDVLIKANDASLVSKIYKLKYIVIRSASDAQQNRLRSHIPGGIVS